MRVDALADPGCDGAGADDLADALARQYVRRPPGTLLTTGEQWPSPLRADLHPQQLRQGAPDRHLPTLAAFAPADGDHALGEAATLYPELHQVGRSSASFLQGLQHQAGASVTCVGPVEEPQLLLDAQPVKPLRRSGAARKPALSLAALKTALLWA